MLLELKYSLLFQDVCSAVFYNLPIRTRHFAYRRSLIPFHVAVSCSSETNWKSQTGVSCLTRLYYCLQLTRDSVCGCILKPHLKISDFKSNAYLTFVEKLCASIFSFCVMPRNTVKWPPNCGSFLPPLTLPQAILPLIVV